GKLPGRGGAENLSVALAPDEHRVVAVDCVRKGVVGRDLRGLERVVVVGDQPCFGKLLDAGTDAAGEFARRLAREREPENLARPDVAVGEQPEHSIRHGLGLATACSRDNQRGRKRCLNDRDLLTRRMRSAEGIRYLNRVSHSTPPEPGGESAGWSRRSTT